jgi:hypothetical protein
MEHSPQEVRTLPPEEAGKVGGRAIEWSDSWSDEDLAEATAAAVRRFEEEEHADR